MADGGNAGCGTWENWLGGWVQTAKEKSNSALEFVKKDLAEFTSTVQKEAEKAVEKTSSSLKDSLTRENTEQASNMVRTGITSFLDNISKVLVIPPDDDYIPMKVSADGSAFYDRGKARLHAIQLDASTYIDPPKGSPEQYNMWVESFDMDQHKGQISELLVTKVEIRALYTRLVPSDVSHADFWQRYFYKVHQLQCDEARKQALMQRAERTRGDDSLGWDDDWSGGEEDDGNQSDWEKMPRPQRSETSSKPSSDEPSVTQASCVPQAASLPVSHSVSVNEKPVDVPAPESPRPQSPVLSSQNDTTSASVDNTESSGKPSDKISSVSPVENDSPSQSPQVPSEELCLESRPQAELWSLHIPSDTASASHQDQDDETFQERVDCDLNSPTDTQARMDLSCAGAAAGVDILEDNTGTVSAAGGACGAVDMTVSPSTQSHPTTSDIPAASSTAHISVQKDSQSESTPLSSDEVKDATSTSDVEVKGDDDDIVRTHAPESIPEVKETEEHEESGGNDAPTAPTSALSCPDDALVVEATSYQDDESAGIAVSMKGDMVVVGDRISPSTDSSGAKDLALDEDWEKDFDIEVTEEDLKAAEDIAKKLGQNLDAEDEDWENWE